MKLYKVITDYNKVDERRFRILESEIPCTNYLTYEEVCYEMRKILEDYVEKGILTKDKAFDFCFDIPAFNDFMDRLEYGIL